MRVVGYVVHGVVVGAGAGVVIVDMTASRVFFLGVMAVVVGVASFYQLITRQRIARMNRPADEAYELGFQMGYDRGFIEGRKTVRPVVVPMQREVTT